MLLRHVGTRFCKLIYAHYIAAERHSHRNCRNSPAAVAGDVSPRFALVLRGKALDVARCQRRRRNRAALRSVAALRLRSWVAVVDCRSSIAIFDCESSFSHAAYLASAGARRRSDAAVRATERDAKYAQSRSTNAHVVRRTRARTSSVAKHLPARCAAWLDEPRCTNPS